MTFRLRAALESDAAAVAAIYAHAVREGVATFEETPPDAEEMAGRMRKIFGGGYPFLVAEQGGRILGYAYASPWNERSAYRFTAQDSIYIDKDSHRRGLGRLLLGALLNECRKSGYRQMMAIVGGASPPSIALHAALGYREIGRAESLGFKFGRWLDVVYMQKAL